MYNVPVQVGVVDFDSSCICLVVNGNYSIMCVLFQVSKHPGLNKYITDSLRTVCTLLRQKMLKCVSLCFYDENERPIERFVFDILDIEVNLKTNYDL